MKRVCYFESVDEERKRWLTEDVRIVRMRERTSEREQETDGSGGEREEGQQSDGHVDEVR